MKALLTFALLATLLFASCRKEPVAATTPAAAPTESYVPGLGEIMTLQQMRHVKLWLAGEAKNWDLASYEMDELEEGFDDVVKYHPTHKGAPVAPKDAIPRMITIRLQDLRSVIQNKDVAQFEPAFDKFTEGCNSCHEAMNFGFNVVQRPASNPYPNQLFTVQKK